MGLRLYMRSKIASIPSTPDHSKSRPLARLWASAYFPVLLLIAVNLIIGALIVTDFGESWDEQLRQRYALDSIKVYRGDSASLKDDKGPFYVITAHFGAQLLHTLIPGWQAIDGWHFMHFLAFQLAIFCLYDLAQRMLSRPAATGAALLFSTQPLLWGHAFINPKDIPLMAFFLASISTGLMMLRRLEQQIPANPLPNNAPANLANGWKETLHIDLSQPVRRLRLGFAAAAAVLLAGIFPLLASPLIQSWIAALVAAAYQAEPGTLLGRVFSQVAAHSASLPVHLYIQKAQALFTPLALAVAFAALAASLWIVRRLLPRTANYTWRAWLQPGLKDYARAMVSPPVLLAGLVLGLTTSIRFFGPLAGGMLALLVLSRRGWRSIPPLAAYASVALVITYAAWPALWGAPWRAFSTSLSSAANFNWEGKVLFAGIEYAHDALPASYLPTLLAIQISEPALLLFFGGLGLGVYRAWRGEVDRAWYAILAAWFFLPVLGFVALTPNSYDNFRHLMFILPPVFLFAGVALEAVFRLARRPWLQFVLLAAILLPNLVAVIQLHPYSYVYYNSLAGGVTGATRRFELDYWATSYRAITLHLNQAAGEGANVIVWGPDHIVAHYARPDLNIIEFKRADDMPIEGETYVVLSSRHEKDRTLYGNAPVVYQVAPRGAVLAVLKKIR